MTLTPRQRALVDEIEADPAIVDGARRTRLPVLPDDAVAIAADLQAQMDLAAGDRARAARKAGVTIACGAGCTGCCEELVMVFRGEAMRVARWLARPENQAARRAFLDAYPAWQARVGDGPARLAETFRDDEAHQAAMIAQWRKRVLCAFNQDGLCTIYPVRPVICRNAHAAETSARCSGDSEEPARRLVCGPVDAFFDAARAVARGVHHAIGGPRNRPAALCEAVAEALR